MQQWVDALARAGVTIKLPPRNTCLLSSSRAQVCLQPILTARYAVVAYGLSTRYWLIG